MSQEVPTTSFGFIGLDQPGMERLAMHVALALAAGDTVSLVGDLGAGKTTFARALIRAFTADQLLEVVSPTFSLLQTYNGRRGRIDHFDLYRLNEAAEAEEIGIGDADAGTIRIIEWADRLGNRLTDCRLDICIEDDSSGGDRRSVSLHARGPLAGRIDRMSAGRDFVVKAGWSAARIMFLQGDASTRRYARLLRDDGTSSILMDSPRQPDGPVVRDGKPYSRIAHLAEDVKPFTAVDHALRRAGLSAPAILAADLERGFLLLEDLGDRVYGRESDGGAHQEKLWSVAIDMLAAFRRADLPRTMPIDPADVSAGTHALPDLDATILGIEVALLPDWHWPELFGAPMPADIRAEYEALWQPVIATLLDAPKGWILRDVHSPNLMWLPERQGIARVGVIDFQDAIAGPWTHDVMSLLQDARVDVAADLEHRLLARYVAAMTGHPGFDAAEFHATYAAYGALRATRLLGLFVRLLRRDHKPGYLAHIPRNWAYLERNLAHPLLQPLRQWYDRHFSPEVRRRDILP